MPKAAKLPEVYDIQAWRVGTLLRYARMYRLSTLNTSNKMKETNVNHEKNRSIPGKTHKTTGEKQQWHEQYENRTRRSTGRMDAKVVPENGELQAR